MPTARVTHRPRPAAAKRAPLKSRGVDLRDVVRSSGAARYESAIASSQIRTDLSRTCLSSPESRATPAGLLNLFINGMDAMIKQEAHSRVRSATTCDETRD